MGSQTSAKEQQELATDVEYQEECCQSPANDAEMFGVVGLEGHSVETAHPCEASRKYLKQISLHCYLEEWFDNVRMVINIDMIHSTTATIFTVLEMYSMTTKAWLVNWVELVSTSVNYTTGYIKDSMGANSFPQISTLSSPLSWISKPGMFCPRCQEYDCSQVLCSLPSLTRKDLQLVTHACIPLLTKNMTIYISAWFHNGLGVLHWQLGVSHIQASNNCLKQLISLQTIFEDWMDQAELTGVLNVMIRPTGPIRFTDTSLVMGNITMDSDEFWLVLMFFFCCLRERMPRSILRI